MIDTTVGDLPMTPTGPQDANRPLRILVVDDDEGVRAFLIDLLRAEGHEASEAADGADAVRQMRSRPCDLVITDLCMPEKEGFETIQELRRSYPRLKIIAISGKFGTSLLSAATKLGADAALPKPLDVVQLLETVARLAL